MDGDIALTPFGWGPTVCMPRPFFPGCLNELEAYDPPRVGGRFCAGGPPPQPTCAAQPPGRPSPGAPVRHGQDKFLYKETFLSVQMGGLSKHFSLWALKWSRVADLAGSPGLRCRWAGSKQSSSP